jgi:hypothetical protein
MKPILAVGLLLLGGMCSSSAQSPWPQSVPPDLVKDAAGRVIQELVDGFLTSPPVISARSVRRYAVLPLTGDLDGGYLAEQLRGHFIRQGTADGFELYLSRSGPEWEALLGEIEWGQTAGEGALDPATVQRFGRLQGVQGLLAPKWVSVTVTPENQLRVRMTLQAFVIETGRLLHGEERSTVVDLPAPDPLVRAQQRVEEVEATLRAVPDHWWITAGSIVGGLVLLVGLGAVVRRAARPR